MRVTSTLWTHTTALILSVLSGFALAKKLPDLPCEKFSIPTNLPRLVIVGEVHGTVEHQAVAAQFLCEAAKSGTQTILALELRTAEQNSIDRFLRSKGSPADVADLLNGPMWQNDSQFGIASEAMLDLFKRVWQLRKLGAAIDIRAFDPPLPMFKERPTKEQLSVARQARESAMAKNISALAASPSTELVIALIGRAHVSKSDAFKSPDFKSVAHILTETNKYLSVGVSHKGGSAWVCTLKDDREVCGAQEFETFTPLPTDFDLVISVNTLTPSPPAVKKKKSEYP
jgi:hypothetical protein